MTPTQQTKLFGALGFLAVWTGLVVLATCGVYSCTHECPTVSSVAASTIDVQSVPTPYPVYVPKLVYKWLPAKVTPVVKESFTADTATVKDSLTVQPCPDFIAEADSTNDSVRVRMTYVSAEQRFAYELQWLKPLMPLVPLTTITKTNTTYEKREWWIDALTHLGAASIGVGVGSLIR